MPLNFQPFVPNPGLRDLLLALKDEIFLNLNCHAVATIKEVNFEAQTVTATIDYCKTYFKQNANGDFEPVNFNYPLLSEIPFIVLGGGTSALTFVISEGDSCLVLFNDRDLQNWAADAKPVQNLNMGGTTQPVVASNRLHSIADGIALIGLNSVANYSATHSQLTDGTAKIGFNVSTHRILITNGTPLSEVLTDITSALTDLVTALNTAFAVTAVPGSPLDPAWAATVLPVTVAISAANTAISGLLE